MSLSVLPVVFFKKLNMKREMTRVWARQHMPVMLALKNLGKEDAQECRPAWTTRQAPVPKANRETNDSKKGYATSTLIQYAC